MLSLPCASYASERDVNVSSPVRVITVRAGACPSTVLSNSHEFPFTAVSFIGGLSGSDITEDHFARVIEITARAVSGDLPDGPVWLNEND